MGAMLCTTIPVWSYVACVSVHDGKKTFGRRECTAWHAGGASTPGRFHLCNGSQCQKVKHFDVLQLNQAALEIPPNLNLIKTEVDIMV